MTIRITVGAMVVGAMTTLSAQTSLPASSLDAGSHTALEKRCGTAKTASPESVSALQRARWVPFLHLDQVIARNGIEVVGGMTAATPGCEPESFNLFVFVDGAFAGTLSRTAMTPSRNSVAGAVRITGADSLTVEFATFTASDAACCPSSRERVSYLIDKKGAGATLVATDTRQLR